MPKVSGAELGARLAELRPDVPVLYMSGHTVDAERIPPDALIARPFRLVALRDRMPARSVAATVVTDHEISAPLRVPGSR